MHEHEQTHSSAYKPETGNYVVSMSLNVGVSKRRNSEDFESPG